MVLPAGIETLDDKAFFGAEIKAVSISGDSSRYIVSDGILCEMAEAAENSEDRGRRRQTAEILPRWRGE